MEPLAAIGLFLCYQKPSILQIDKGIEDVTLKLLYQIVLDHVQDLIDAEDEKIQGIKVICGNTSEYLMKTKSCLKNGDAEKTLVYLDNTSIF